MYKMGVLNTHTSVSDKAGKNSRKKSLEVTPTHKASRNRKKEAHRMRNVLLELIDGGSELIIERVICSTRRVARSTRREPQGVNLKACATCKACTSYVLYTRVDSCIVA